MKNSVNVQLVKLGRVSEELQSILGDEFEVSFSDNGLTLYNKNKKYQLTESETYQFIKDAGLELRYAVLDENQQYCIFHSIKLIDRRNKEYTYTTYPKAEHCYPTFKQTIQTIDYLQFMCNKAKMNHSFSVAVFTVPKPKNYAVYDQYNRVADFQSISLVPSDDESTIVWQYRDYKSIAVGCFFHSSIEDAEKSIRGLDFLKVIAGFNDLEFTIKEVDPYNQDVKDRAAKDWSTCKCLEIPKGKKTLARQQYRDYIKQYH